MGKLVEIFQSSVVTQGTLAVMVVGAVVYQVIAGQQPNEALLTLAGGILSYFFVNKQTAAVTQAIEKSLEKSRQGNGS